MQLTLTEALQLLIDWAQPTPAERAAADAAVFSTKGGGGMLRWVC